MSEPQVTITYGATLNKTEDVSKAASTPAEFERFEKLTGKLVQVPKSELDDKLKES